MMGSPDMLGLLGMQFLQQAAPHPNRPQNDNNMLGLLPLLLQGNSQQAPIPTPQAAVPNIDKMDLLKGYTDIMQNTARTPAEMNDIKSNQDFINRYQPAPTSNIGSPSAMYGPMKAQGDAPRVSPYFTQLQQAAQQSYPNNPVMQQVAMSQALLESGTNPSKLATQNNNYFGIKSQNGASMATQEYVNGRPVTQQASFATNPNMQASFNQHRDLLSGSRYAPVMSAGTPLDAFNALQKAGYATDPRYAAKLASIYNRYVQPAYMG